MAIDFQYRNNLRSSFSFKLLLCGLLTFGVMYSHRFLPTKTFLLVPSVHIKQSIYGDMNTAGVKVVSWLDFEGLSWRCDMPNDGKQYVCGFSVAIEAAAGSKGFDASSYDAINVELEYAGNDKRLRFYMRSFVPGFSDMANIETSQFINANIRKSDINKALHLNFSEFSVAEWWINTYQASRELTYPNFHNVQTFGVDLSYPSAPGYHDYKLKKVEFVGLWVSAEQWYLSIICFWIAVIFLGGGANLIRLKREYTIERQRLERVVSQNSALAMETNKYKQLSMVDQLTGLLNRHGLSEYIETNFDDSQPRKTALIIIDIDFFKKINDAYGHEGGDKVLIKIAEVIREQVRASDYSARWGGEEFVILLPNAQAPAAHLIAEKLRSMVALTQFDYMPDLQVTISLGVGAIDGLEPFHMLFRRVDLALYQAKAQGRNRTVLADSAKFR